MPPYRLWLRGPEAIAAWLLGRGVECRGSRLVPRASRGLARFRAVPAGPAADTGRGRWPCSSCAATGSPPWNSFLDTETFFPRFALPPALPA